MMHTTVIYYPTTNKKQELYSQRGAASRKQKARRLPAEAGRSALLRWVGGGALLWVLMGLLGAAVIAWLPLTPSAHGAPRPAPALTKPRRGQSVRSCTWLCALPEQRPGVPRAQYPKDKGEGKKLTSCGRAGAEGSEE